MKPKSPTLPPLIPAEAGIHMWTAPGLQVALAQRARGGAACETDRLRSYVRSVVTVAHDRCQDGFRNASSKQYCDLETAGFRGVSRIWDRSITLICIVSSKLRPQREGSRSRAELVKRWSARGDPAPSGTAAARGAARSPQQAQRRAPRGGSPWRGRSVRR